MQDRESRDWIVVGSSPGVERYFDPLIDALPGATTITANGGIGLFMSREDGPLYPDYYWLSDMKACELFRRYWKAIGLRGSKRITFKRERTALRERGLDDVDELIDMGGVPENPTPLYERGRYVWPVLSGVMITQYALNHGAERVFWIGMAGYESTPNNVIRDTFDGRHGKAGGWNHTQNVIRPFMQSCIDRCPDVEFYMLGAPTYQLEPRPNFHPFNRFKDFQNAISDQVHQGLAAVQGG